MIFQKALLPALLAGAVLRPRRRQQFMHHGKVHEEGRPKDLFAAPKSPELAQFIGSIG